MSDRIAGSLRRLFDEHRVIFWYDAAKDMRAEYDALDLDDVEKIEIANNEFGLKYRMLRQEPKQKFLVYKEDTQPSNEKNWLLDLQLAGTVFKADQAAIWLNELGLSGPLEDVVRDHMEFYRSAARVEHLKQLVTKADTKTEIRRKMLAVCAGADGAFDTVIEALLGQSASERDDALRLINRSNLSDFFWEQLGKAYGYRSDQPDFEDFVITFFKSAWYRALGEDGTLNAEALLIFRRWKNNRRHAEAFETLAAKWQGTLKIPEDLTTRETRDLHDIDHFEEVDRHVIRSLVAAMASQTVSAAEVLKLVRERRQSHWYPRYADIYLAIGYATEFQQALTEAKLGMTSPEEGVKRYVGSWYKLDQYYRKFIYHMQRSAEATTLLSALFESVENRYTTSFLQTLNDAWQDQIARLSDWAVPGYSRQMDFYREQAAAFRRRDQKVVVIISDALRFEVAEECLREIRKLNRFEAELTPMIGALPSYTQLGMAALLPNDVLTLDPDGSGSVISFGKSTQGTANREKILAHGRDGDRVKAMKADDFMALKADDGKTLFRDHDIVYLYHNRIDHTGDKLATEEKFTEAAENAIEDLTKLVRKLTTANFSNILITADHGFLYQHRPLDEAGFSIAEPTGEAILVKNRRFVIGRGLNAAAGMKRFTSSELGLAGNLDVLIPNSINRMRVKGAGSRFVHVITSGQTAVTLYQSQSVSEKLQQRDVVAGIFAADGKLISDEHDLTFDFASQNARERELPLKFLMSRDADAYNDQDVHLKLRERVGKTSHFEDYASHRFQLRRGIMTDFDFE